MQSKDQNWYAENQRVNKIKAAVRSFISNGVQFGYEWDAGGDNTLCWPVTEPETEPEEWLTDELYDIIVEKLQLPNAGDHYKKGKGEFFFREDDALMLRYSLEDTDSYEEEELNTDTVRDEISVPITDEMDEFLKRGGIGFDLNYDWKGNVKLDVNIRVDEGETIQISEETKNQFLALMKPYAELYKDNFGPRDGKMLAGFVRVICGPKRRSKASLMYYPRYNWLSELINEEILLFA